MIEIQISIGELIDKLSILYIKKNKVTDSQKLAHINTEYNLLMNEATQFFLQKEVENLYLELIEVNSDLWVVEDTIREFESNKKFDEEFIELARKVYFTNDRRFLIKNKINELTNSSIREIKNYKEYK